MDGNEKSSIGRTWVDKFRDAFRGLKLGVLGQSSFAVHLPVAAAVIALAAMLKVDAVEWCLLLLCITGVLVAEMFNSAMESLAKAITDEHHPNLGSALDISAAAVLIASAGAVAVGAIIFLPRLVSMLAAS